ncbi:hypothetical protein [Novosphingobium guangzhouense]|uniref:hypothetical protein n=1 Tax=Novosphingobium guangzhouense TaxID=1850347 RepID=UPI0011AF05ED|nr:hypothetical protein [Novosphingobium guangzhouense]
MIADECLMPKNRSKIKLEENGKSAIFLNPSLDAGLQAIKVDGCVEQKGTRADFVIEYKNRAVVVELKGKDVEKAAKQVLETANQWKHQLSRCDEVAGLIVAERFPKASSKVQIRQDEFRKKYLNPLHVVCCNEEYDFDAVFTFRPLKRRK